MYVAQWIVTNWTHPHSQHQDEEQDVFIFRGCSSLICVAPKAKLCVDRGTLGRVRLPSLPPLLSSSRYFNVGRHTCTWASDCSAEQGRATPPVPHPPPLGGHSALWPATHLRVEAAFVRSWLAFYFLLFLLLPFYRPVSTEQPQFPAGRYLMSARSWPWRLP